jgi:Plasmid recombination enzyme
MYRLSVHGSLLKLNGLSKTIALAEAHNLRKIAAEFKTFKHIDRNRSHLNVELVPSGDQPLTQKVLEIVKDAGIDPNKGVNKRFGKAYAIEWVFTTTHGFRCNFESLYKDCLDWLTLRYPTCPIVHAVIHYDESDPHMHVIMVPIVGKNLPSSKLLGYKGICRKRNEDLFKVIGQKYGFTSGESLKGSAKRMASIKAIEACEKLNWHDFRKRLWQPLIHAIQTRPEPFLKALDISVSDLQEMGQYVVTTTCVAVNLASQSKASFKSSL